MRAYTRNDFYLIEKVIKNLREMELAFVIFEFEAI